MAGGTCDVLVVGAGVSGLTTAVCLAEAGLRVRVWSAQPPEQTTSMSAGAVWGPHLVEASDRATRWGAETMAVLAGLAADPATGIRPGAGVMAVRGTAAVPPDWITPLPGFGPCDPAGLPDGFTAGWRFTAPTVDMPVYLRYLRARLRNSGGVAAAATVSSLRDAGRACGAAAVVNCTGIGAHGLVPDPQVSPVRGQIVVAENPGLTDFFIGLPSEASDLVYVIPHGDVVVLGGTTVAGDWSTEPYPAVAGRILRDCAAAEPRLRNARVLGHRVGLRPVRPSVRLEAEPADGGTGAPAVVHNYGHGGAGVTVSWGCARDAAALVTGRQRRGASAAGAECGHRVRE